MRDLLGEEGRDSRAIGASSGAVVISNVGMWCGEIRITIHWWVRNVLENQCNL